MFLAAEIPKRHKNAFHHTSREAFEQAVANLDHELAGMNGDAIFVGLDRLVNMIGDGHTFIEYPGWDTDFPLKIVHFGSEYRVIATTADHKKALGARIVSVEDTPITRARELILPLTPQDETPELREEGLQNILSSGLALHGLGITPQRMSARYRMSNDQGQEFDVLLHAKGEGSPEWVYPFSIVPLFRQHPREGFWYTYMPESKAVYCNFRSYDNLDQKAPGLLALIKQRHPVKVIIDLRQNGGGNFALGLKYIVNPLRDMKEVNIPEHLFALIGPSTFSAAMSNATHFRYRTHAMLVGQTIGERPNSYQEERHMTLPNSHLTVHYSTRYYRFIKNGENLVRPDREIIPTWEDFKAGRDPVLDWVMNLSQ
jgi:hypothetical protein